jgi:dihydroorotate dehydrogenase (fumarate)
MTDLATTYLGLRLKHPVVASAGPLSRTLDGIRQLEDAGAAAIVLFSLFEEQIRLENAATEHLIGASAESFAEALDYFPAVEDYEVGPEPYLELIRRAREATEIPIIASLNGTTPEGWLDYARQIEQAGASALELNVYHIPADLTLPAREVEELYLHVLREVKAAVRIPIAMKLNPFFSALGEMARHLVSAGADGLVLFNRFFQPDIDPENLTLERRLELSDSRELLPRLGWIALLSGVSSVSFAASGGVHTTRDAVRAIVAGADVVQVVSALLQRGPEYIGALRRSFVEWMEEHEYDSLEQLRGSMNGRRCPDPQMLGRVNYMRLLQSWRP